MTEVGVIIHRCVGQVLTQSWATSDKSPRKFSIFFNPILLSCGGSIRGSGNGDLDDCRSEPVIARFRMLVRTSATLVSWIPIVWREVAQSRSWNGSRFRYWLKLASVQLHWDQLPNPTCVETTVILELYLGYTRFSGGLKILLWDGD